MKKTVLFLLLAMKFYISNAQNLPLIWQSRFAGAGDNSDKFNKIISVPGGDYVAVGFTTRNGKYKDFLTVKISGTNLDTLWTRTKGTGDGDDEAISCAADASGNIYVTGYRDGGTTQDDIYTIKYSAAGTDLWDTSYNDVSNAFLDDRPVDCGVDQNGDFILAGWTEQGSWAVNQDDYVVMKYNASGTLLWRTQYDRSGFKDEAAAMAIDGSGNVFVTGRSSNGTDDDFVTMKLDGTNGNQLWTPVKIFSGGGGDDRATDIALDNAGNPVVTGRFDNPSSGNDDYKTLKYSSAGTLQWSRTWTGAAQNDRSACLAIDQSNNDVYVAGSSDVDLSSVTDYDLAIVKYNASGTQQWWHTWGGAAQGDDVTTAIAVDAFGNVIICGSTDADPATGVSNNDWITIKYNSAGTKQYEKIKNGSRDDDDIPSSIVIDAAGNAIVAGYLNNTATQKDASRIEYDAIGNAAFTASYNGEGDFNESAHAMVQDAAGNTYIAGYSYTESDNKNIFAGKIDASGNLVDTFFYNGTNDDDDELNAVANDGNGNIYACGYTKTNGEKSNFILVKFNFQAYPLADTAWTKTYNFVSQSDKAVSMAADATGIYITGSSDANANDTTDNDDIVTMKFSAGGALLWTQRYDDALGWRDEPVKMILGQNNRVYVVGRNSNIHDDDIVLLSYDRTSGNPVAGFPAIWNSNFQDDDRPADLIEDGSGNIYVAGYSQSGSFVEDYTLLKYFNTGVLDWAASYDGLASQEDKANALALDASGNVVVAGQTDVNSDPLVTNYNYGTFIYDASGNYVCSAALPFNYNGAGDGDDVPVAVNVSGNNILVTGQSAEGTSLARNKNIMVRIYDQGTCGELPEFAEYDGPAGGGDAPNATLLVSQAIFICGSSDAANNQKDIIALKFDLQTGLSETSATNGSTYVYPNPFNNTAIIRIGDDLNTGGELSVKVYNVLGEEIITIKNVRNSVVLDKNDFANGVYSYKVFNSVRPLAGGRFVVN